MRRTGLLYDERFLLHCTGFYHPETSDRLLAIYRGIEESGLLQYLTRIKASPAKLEWVEAVHSPKLIKRLAEACGRGKMCEFDHPDNRICKETYDTALLAVGGVVEAARLVAAGELDNAFCAVRPPGHHAEFDKALGFCFFNNIAIAARYLQNTWAIKRIGIVDFDVHHGNGTQHIFDQDPSVFYYSIHEHPSYAYPGTGHESERGCGLGSGFTLNSPMMPGMGDEAYAEAVRKVLMPAFDWFKPEIILLSTGFDAHKEDIISHMSVTTEGFSRIMEQIVEMGEKHAQGRIVSILEGGYCLNRLPELTVNHLKILLGL
ncbi:MAG: histone deacetylase [Syntrophobacteraceae bacterium]